MAHFRSLTPGADNFTGQAGDDNAFQFDAATLQSNDTVTGTTGSFLDLLIATGGGSIVGSQFGGVTNIEELFLAKDGNSIMLTDSLVAGSSIGYFAVVDGIGSDRIDASAVTATPVVFFAAGGSDSFKGGHGNDAIVIAAADLATAEMIDGGSGIDNLYVSSAGVVDPSAFDHVSGIEGIVLSAAQGNSITLTNSLVGGSDIGTFAIADGAGNDVIDASGVSNGVPIAFLASGGGDTFRGGNGANGFVFNASDLTAADTVQGGTGIDNLFIATAGTLDASSFTNVTGTEAVVLSDGVNHVTLTNGLVAGTSLGYYVVIGGAGNDTVDASGVSNATPIAFFGSGGNDTFTGGSGNDAFLFAADQLGATDTVSGGGASDTLWITTAGTIDTAKLAGVSRVEGVLLQNGGTFDLADHITTSSTFAAVGSGAIDAFDGSAITAYAINFVGNGGADDLKGGSRDDTFFIKDSAFAGIDGGAGIDRITLTEADQSLDVSANAAKMHNIEVISLDDVDHGSVTLTATDIARISSSNSLYIVGDIDDSYEAGTGYTQIGSGIANNAVASGHLFYEFRHSSGSLLYIDANFFGPLITEGAGGIVPENSPTDRVVYTDQSIYLPGTTVTHTLFGTDAALFDIDATTGNVTFKVSPDFENPQDQGKDNFLDFGVTIATDRAVPVTFQLSGASITDVNDNAPVFTSATSATTPENVATTTAVYTAHATDADATAANNTVSYFLTAGFADNDRFNIDANGDLRFKVAPDYETPMDSNHDNEYDIEVWATDGLHAHDAALHIAIAVSDVLLL